MQRLILLDRNYWEIYIFIILKLLIHKPHSKNSVSMLDIWYTNWSKLQILTFQLGIARYCKMDL